MPLVHRVCILITAEYAGEKQLVGQLVMRMGHQILEMAVALKAILVKVDLEAQAL